MTAHGIQRPFLHCRCHKYLVLYAIPDDNAGVFQYAFPVPDYRHSHVPAVTPGQLLPYFPPPEYVNHKPEAAHRKLRSRSTSHRKNAGAGYVILTSLTPVLLCQTRPSPHPMDDGYPAVQCCCYCTFPSGPAAETVVRTGTFPQPIVVDEFSYYTTARSGFCFWHLRNLRPCQRDLTCWTSG